MLEFRELKDGQGCALLPSRTRERTALSMLCGGLLALSTFTAHVLESSKTRELFNPEMVMVATLLLCITGIGVAGLIFSRRILFLVAQRKIIIQESPFKKFRWDFDDILALEYSGGGPDVLLADCYLKLRDGRRIFITNGPPTSLGPASLKLIKMLNLPPETMPEMAPGPGLPVREGLNLRVMPNASTATVELPPMANTPQVKNLPLD